MDIEKLWRSFLLALKWLGVVVLLFVAASGLAYALGPLGLMGFIVTIGFIGVWYASYKWGSN